MKLNFCGQRMTLPEQMDEPGTMLMDGKPCPTHQIVDAPRGYVVRTGNEFWMQALETLSSSVVKESAEHDHPKESQYERRYRKSSSPLLHPCRL
jgi:hypothetical protein